MCCTLLHMCYKALIGSLPGFSPKKLAYFIIFFFNWNENKIEINFIFWFLLCYTVIYLEITIEIRQVHIGLIKLPLTIIFWKDALSIFLMNFCYFIEVLAFLDYILFLTKGSGQNLILECLNLPDKEKITVNFV